MLSSLRDISTLKSADCDNSHSARGLLRVSRRIAKRCWLDQETINRPRIFCQNSGGCGSTYIVDLMTRNGVARCFHEKTPDLLEVGLDHYERPLADGRLVRLLRYTRHDVFFEANNRLFSLTRQLAAAFPTSTFLHLHRDAAESIRSSMSKQDVPAYLRDNIRFRGTLAGPHDCDAFTRVCHHWANMNRRIHDDLQSLLADGQKPLSLRFEDLIAGRVELLEQTIEARLDKKTSQPVNVRPTRAAGKFPTYPAWSLRQKQTFERICEPVMELLGR